LNIQIHFSERIQAPDARYSAITP